MTISGAFNKIAKDLGGDPGGNTVQSSINAVTDALAGEDVPTQKSIESEIKKLGEKIVEAAQSGGEIVISDNLVFIADTNTPPVVGERARSSLSYNSPRLYLGDQVLAYGHMSHVAAGTRIMIPKEFVDWESPFGFYDCTQTKPAQGANVYASVTELAREDIDLDIVGELDEEHTEFWLTVPDLAKDHIFTIYIMAEA